MQIYVFILLAVALQMARKCEGGEEKDTIECLEESDPMGAKYKGTMSKTENGLECQKWDSNEFHKRYEIATNDLDNNYCRNPHPDRDSSVKPWCYTTDPDVPWEYCSISSCTSCTGMEYDNKCFVAVVFEGDGYHDYAGGIDRDGAVAECNGRGGNMANIYSQTHMDEIVKYIRRVLGSADFRTGLNFDPQKRKLTLRDGTDAPAGLKWANNAPFTEDWNADDTEVILGVGPDRARIWNQTPEEFKYQVLCEIEE